MFGVVFGEVCWGGAGVNILLLCVGVWVLVLGSALLICYMYAVRSPIV